MINRERCKMSTQWSWSHARISVVEVQRHIARKIICSYKNPTEKTHRRSLVVFLQTSKLAEFLERYSDIG